LIAIPIGRLVADTILIINNLSFGLLVNVDWLKTTGIETLWFLTLASYQNQVLPGGNILDNVYAGWFQVSSTVAKR
jgi:hypothetical protein